MRMDRGDRPLGPKCIRRLPGYQAHPSDSAIARATPEWIVEGMPDLVTVDYESVLGLHGLVLELMDVVARQHPHYISFFATGSLPITFPLIQRLAESHADCLRSGEAFHMFPGLSWRKKLEGMTSRELFLHDLENELRKLDADEAPKLLLLDTTNTGNAVNAIARALVMLCQKLGFGHLEIRVVGVLNRGFGGYKDSTQQAVLLQCTSGAPIRILLPRGWRHEGEIRDREWCRLQYRTKRQSIDMLLYYMVVDDLFTEDSSELIGALELQDRLGVQVYGKSPGLWVRGPDGNRTWMLGADTNGVRLTALLSTDLDSIPWTVLRKNIGIM